MRLTPHQIEAIRSCARTHFGEGAVVRLFGSRVRDDLRGGDIDLHITTETADRASPDRDLRFRKDLAGRIGDQKNDVLVNGPQGPQRPIEHIAVLTGVIL